MEELPGIQLVAGSLQVVLSALGQVLASQTPASSEKPERNKMAFLPAN